jgi:thiamine pyrophosphate-dependent acetolactate synthase large subunit-like protein
MEAAGLRAAQGTGFPNIDFAAFARACGAKGFTVRAPAELGAAIRAFLAEPGPAILHAFVDPAELPVMPHVSIGQAWRFGIAKIKERFGASD